MGNSTNTKWSFFNSKLLVYQRVKEIILIHWSSDDFSRTPSFFKMVKLHHQPALIHYKASLLFLMGTSTISMVISYVSISDDFNPSIFSKILWFLATSQPGISPEDTRCHLDAGQNIVLKLAPGIGGAGKLGMFLGKFDHDRTLFSLTGIMVYVRKIIPKWPQDSG